MEKLLFRESFFIRLQISALHINRAQILKMISKHKDLSINLLLNVLLRIVMYIVFLHNKSIVDLDLLNSFQQHFNNELFVFICSFKLFLSLTQKIVHLLTQKILYQLFLLKLHKFALQFHLRESWLCLLMLRIIHPSIDLYLLLLYHFLIFLNFLRLLQLFFESQKHLYERQINLL